jgi:drug/metabolite transporter (DMT)-like permease
MTPSGHSAQSSARGIAYMCVTAIVMFPALNASVKYLTDEYSLVQIIWVRSVIHMMWMLVLFLPNGDLKLFATSKLALQLVRSALQLVALVFYVMALIYIPLTTATAIAFTAPLMVVALSVPMLGERVGPRRWIAVLVGFVGALIIIRPGEGAVGWPSLLVVGAAVCYALFQILTRSLARHDDVRTTAIYTILVALVLSSIAVPFFWAMPHGLIDWLVFLGLGLFGGLGHVFIIKAYEYGSASVVGPFDYGQLIGATAAGYVVFGDFPDFWTWVGAAILVASGVYIARREARGVGS